MKYLVLKGCEGLGVRLHTLANAIEICKRTRRVLWVDWSDSVYGAEGFDPFWDFFRIRTVPMVSQLTERDKRANLKVRDPIWQGKLDKHVYEFYKKGNYANEWTLREKLGFVPDIKRYLKNQTPILVLCRCHNRESECIKDIEFSTSALEIAKAFKEHWIGEEEFLALNVRFTDKHMELDMLKRYFNRARDIYSDCDLPIFLTTDSTTARDLAQKMFHDRVCFLPRWLDPNDKKNHQNPDCPNEYQRFKETVSELILMGQAKKLIHFNGYKLHGNSFSKSSFSVAALKLGTAEGILVNHRRL